MSSGLSKGASVGLRSEFEDMAGTVIASGNTSNGTVPANSITNAVRLIKLKQMAKVFFLDNTTTVPIHFAVVSPEDTTRTRVDWLTLQAGRIVNFELASNNLLIEAGTEIWVYYTGTAPATGFVSMFTWG
jgi:hypothetical protein